VVKTPRARQAERIKERIMACKMRILVALRK